MSRFTVWSPYDAQPVPARNERERQALISRGYLADPPEQEVASDEPSTTAGADGRDLPAGDKRGRVQGREETVADELGDDTESDGEVPPSAK